VDAAASARKVVRRAVFRERTTARRTNDAIRVRQNRVVLASVADVKLSGGEAGPTGRDLAVNPFSDGDNTNSSPGRARHKPSSHCAGNAGLPPLNLYARVRIPLCNLAHETAGAARTRHSLLPLRWRDSVDANLGRYPRRETAESYSVVITRHPVRPSAGRMTGSGG